MRTMLTLHKSLFSIFKKFSILLQFIFNIAGSTLQMIHTELIAYAQQAIKCYYIFSHLNIVPFFHYILASLYSAKYYKIKMEFFIFKKALFVWKTARIFYLFTRPYKLVKQTLRGKMTKKFNGK